MTLRFADPDMSIVLDSYSAWELLNESFPKAREAWQQIDELVKQQAPEGGDWIASVFDECPPTKRSKLTFYPDM